MFGRCIREEGLEAGVKLTQDLLDTVKAEAERGPPPGQYGYGRGGGYNNSVRYNGVSKKKRNSPPLLSYYQKKSVCVCV